MHDQNDDGGAARATATRTDSPALVPEGSEVEGDLGTAPAPVIHRIPDVLWATLVIALAWAIIAAGAAAEVIVIRALHS
jgi:hypothetical protein